VIDIINDEMALLRAQLGELTVRPIITEMRRQAEKIRASELERTLRHLGNVDAHTLAHLQHFSQSLVNKLLHEPTVRLKEKAGHNQAEQYATALCDLFGLPEHLS
jgi:glutamyl-tRNA reductase